MSMLYELAEKAMEGGSISGEEALMVTSVKGVNLFDLFAQASRIREHFRGRYADLCSIVSAKTGACPEDCTYCAQSARSRAGVQSSPLLTEEEVLNRARSAQENGARRFCIVTSGKRPTQGELENIARMLAAVRDLGLSPCATLGLLGSEDLRMLKTAGLRRYHHNLETSRRHFPEICSTHGYDEKLQTIRSAFDAGLSVCSGGIFGLGETWADRVDMALELRELQVDSVPLNFLVPVPGTPLGERPRLAPLEALHIVALYRFLLPDREIRICGGRLQILGELNALVFVAGADGLLTGDCLTVAGRSPDNDLRLVRAFGLEH